MAANPVVNQYAATFLNPFDSSLAQPKILDGSVTRSAGVRFRNVGSVTLDGTGADTYFILFPGYSTCLCWKLAAAAATSPSVNPSHLGTLTDRENIRRIRLVSSAVKFSLENTSDDNEGTWEAIRIPFNADEWAVNDSTAPIGEDFMIIPMNTFAYPDMANHATYQSGRLKDIDRFLFKLNSVAPDHEFTDLSSTVGGAVSANLRIYDSWPYIDRQFDIVVIKLKGRVSATVPSVIRYDVVSNQEVVYKDGTALGRIMTPNTMLPGMNVILDRTRFMLPAVQIS